MFAGTIPLGGSAGLALGRYLVDRLNLAGTILATVTASIVSVYLVSSFSLAKLVEWFAGPIAWFERRADAFRRWRERMEQRSLQKARARAEKRRKAAEKAKGKSAPATDARVASAQKP
jgi:S-DNA-T family DNA segregation ATPase FtsK/SpoIIIE